MSNSVSLAQIPCIKLLKGLRPAFTTKVNPSEQKVLYYYTVQPRQPALSKSILLSGNKSDTFIPGHWLTGKFSFQYHDKNTHSETSGAYASSNPDRISWIKLDNPLTGPTSCIVSGQNIEDGAYMKYTIFSFRHTTQAAARILVFSLEWELQEEIKT